jgi:hypothetical protein
MPISRKPGNWTLPRADDYRKDTRGVVPDRASELVAKVGKSNNSDFGIRDGIKGIGPREVLSKWGPFGNFESVSGG